MLANSEEVSTEATWVFFRVAFYDVHEMQIIYWAVS